MLTPLDLFTDCLVRYLAPDETTMVISQQSAARLNQMAVGNHTYFVIRQGRTAEAVKYTHTAAVPNTSMDCYGGLVVNIERDVLLAGSYGFSRGAEVSFEWITPALYEFYISTVQ